jgi:acetyl esterase/lipase
MKIIPYRNIPVDENQTFVDTPFMEYVAPQRSDAHTASPAIMLFPGGGYGFLSIEKEGYTPARFFAQQGIASFVVWYRHKTYRHPVPLCDAQCAIRQLRRDHATWGIDPQRIGCMGFSAGGHLASTLGTLYDYDTCAEVTDAACDDAYTGTSARPDFMILIYPVISMKRQQYAHMGSVHALLGEPPDPGLVDMLSTHEQVTGDTPPTMLEHGKIDPGVPVQNSYLFREALQSHHVPVTLYVDDDKEHGYGFAEPTTRRCMQWLTAQGILSHAAHMPQHS